MQLIHNVMDSKFYKLAVDESLEFLSDNQNLKMYFEWALAYKRTWSDSFAFWCDNQVNLTMPKISQKWKQFGYFYRRRDLHDKMDEVEKKRKERIEAEQNPGVQKQYVKPISIPVDQNGMPF